MPEPDLMHRYTEQMMRQWRQMLTILPAPPPHHYWAPKVTRSDEDGRIVIHLEPVAEPIPGSPIRPLPPLD